MVEPPTPGSKTAAGFAASPAAACRRPSRAVLRLRGHQPAQARHQRRHPRPAPGPLATARATHDFHSRPTHHATTAAQPSKHNKLHWSLLPNRSEARIWATRDAAWTRVRAPAAITAVFGRAHSGDEAIWQQAPWRALLLISRAAAEIARGCLHDHVRMGVEETSTERESGRPVLSVCWARMLA